MSCEAALIFYHSMTISHITYCLTRSQASITTLKPLNSLYKQSLKTCDKNTIQFHHCSMLKKYNLLSWENVIKYVHVCLMFKTLHNTTSPLNQFVKVRTTAYQTRIGERGDWIPLKKKVSSVSRYFQ